MLNRASMTTSFLSFLAIAMFAGAADDKPVSQTAATVLEQCELYPLARETIWIYRSGPLEVREKVVRHEEIQGELCARIETFYDERVVSFEHIAVRADGVYRVAVGGKPVEPPLKIISLPAKPGVKWNVDSKIDGKSLRGEFVTSEGSFQARSPRGDQDQSFKTHRVTGETFQAGGEAVSFTYDFVPHLGKVKQTARAHGLETTIELKEIVVAGQTPTRTALGSAGLLRQ